MLELALHYKSTTFKVSQVFFHDYHREEQASTVAQLQNSMFSTSWRAPCVPGARGTGKRLIRVIAGVQKQAW